MGRSSLYMVIGFNVVFGIMGFNISRVSNGAYENYIQNYSSTMAHNIAASAANVGCNQIFVNKAWRAGYSDVPFSGGMFDVQVTELPLGQLRIVAEGRHEGEEATIVVLLGRSSFSKFAYYSVVEGGDRWVTGDTVWGPFHSESKLTVSGNPVFYGKVSVRIGLFKSPASSKPKFYGGFESGVSIDIPNDLLDLVPVAQAGGYYIEGKDLYLEFHSNGTVSYRNAPAGASTTMAISAFAPNGVILTNKGNIHVKGTLNGKVSIAALGSSGLGYGNVYVDDDIVYAGNPRQPGCDDLLGIVCDNNVIVADNAANNAGVNVNASIFCRTGALTAENYNTRKVSGSLNLIGATQQYQRGDTGPFLRKYRYDERLMLLEPPYYPRTGNYEILSWYE